MPQEPKKRHSRQRQGKRRAAIKLSILRPISCSNCSKPIIPHTICKYCGYYDGREVISMAKKEKTNEKPS